MAASVLVVDDELGMRETVADILDDAGYRVDSAADGETALDRLRQATYDVVVMDIRMPGRDGVSVLEELGPPPPQVILMTAYAVEDRLRAAMDAHAYAVVEKPVPPVHLVDLVAAAATAA